MDEALKDFLSRRHDFEAWRGRTALEETSLFILGFLFSDKQFPGWRLHRIRRVESEDAPTFTETMWRRPGGGSDELLSVNVYEKESRTAAHELLLELIGEFMSPLLERQDEAQIGDVAFAVPGDAGIIFARANLVLSMYNAGSDLVSITEIARPFDQELIRQPESGGTIVVPEIPGAPRAQLRVGGEAPLPLAPALAAEPRWYKLFSSSGEVFLEGGRPVYRCTSSGPQQVTVFSFAGAP